MHVDHSPSLGAHVVCILVQYGRVGKTLRGLLTLAKTEKVQVVTWVVLEGFGWNIFFKNHGNVMGSNFSYRLCLKFFWINFFNLYLGYTSTPAFFSALAILLYIMLIVLNCQYRISWIWAAWGSPELGWLSLSLPKSSSWNPVNIQSTPAITQTVW